jgi:cyclophilin family peptidyl-prolyl cis-trans isomerase
MRLLLSCLALSSLLAACGGGGGAEETPPPATTTTITGLSIRMLSDATAPLRYRGSAVVTISGTGLALATMTLGGNACRFGAAPPGYTDTDTARYSICTLIGAGPQQVTVALGTGPVAQTLNVDVPLPQVTLTMASGSTPIGSFVLTLDPVRAPLTVDNFLDYVDAGFYVGTAIHRHSPGFVLQGGGYAAPLGATTLPAPKATNAPIALEVGRGLSNVSYSIAMARTSDPHSATSQFFVNLADNSFLDTSTGGYAVFGSVTTGTTVIDAMRGAPCIATSWLSVGECLPSPNLVITAAAQTR